MSNVAQNFDVAKVDFRAGVQSLLDTLDQFSDSRKANEKDWLICAAWRTAQLERVTADVGALRGVLVAAAATIRAKARPGGDAANPEVLREIARHSNDGAQVRAYLLLAADELEARGK